MPLESLAGLDWNYEALLSASILRNQLVSRFQLTLFWSTDLINNQRPQTEWSTVSTASIQVVGHDDVARTGRPAVNPFANEMYRAEAGRC